MAGLSPRLSQGIRQEQRMSARLLPALTILELPAFELGAYLREAYESNEALTLEEPMGTVEAPAGAETPAEAARTEGYDGLDASGVEVEREDFVAPRGQAGGAEASERHAEWLASQPARHATLAEALQAQLAFLDFTSERQAAWVHHLVGELDGRGLLTQDDDALLLGVRRAGLLARYPLEAEGLDQDAALADAIAVLHGLEPAGIGARSVVEALLLQLGPEDPDLGLLRTLLGDFLEELSANKLPAVASALGLELDELGRLLARLAGAEAALVEPGSTAAPTIHPEVLVEEGPEGFSVQVDGAAWPAVGIDEDLRALAREADPGLKRYLRGKLDQARWIVDAVEQRRTTLLRVARAVFGQQRAFLEHGPGHLVPLGMQAVADLVGVHRSTVSRAVAGKYAWTPWGVFELRYFFQSAAGAGPARRPGEVAGAEMGAPEGSAARDDLRALVERIVAAEDRREPLSDEAIVASLAERGYRVARRTVAKYRRELGIPSSYRRRDHLA